MNKKSSLQAKRKVVASCLLSVARPGIAKSSLDLRLCSRKPLRQTTDNWQLLSYLRRLCSVIRLIRASSFGLKLITSGSSFNVL
jgi:hypothetical protein